MITSLRWVLTAFAGTIGWFYLMYLVIGGPI